MIQINEWLPNPAGTDYGAEWIELWNDGGSSVSLADWKLSDSKKTYSLGDKTLNPGEYWVLNAKTAGLTLRNQEETLTLKRTDGQIESTSHFLGTAQEGKSWAWNGAGYAWSEPSPGKENIFSAILAEDNLPRGVALNKFSSVGIQEAALGAALLLALGIAFLIKRNDDQENIFRGGDQENRGTFG